MIEWARRHYYTALLILAFLLSGIGVAGTVLRLVTT